MSMTIKTNGHFENPRFLAKLKIQCIVFIGSGLLKIRFCELP
jgi:hypothetical protein